MNRLNEIKCGHEDEWLPGDDLCYQAWKDRGWLIAKVEQLRAELKNDRGIRAVVMNEQYAELDGLPEKSMRICEAIQSLRQQLEQLKAGRELT